MFPNLKGGAHWGKNFSFRLKSISHSEYQAEDLVEQRGIEPLTSSLRTTRSPN